MICRILLITALVASISQQASAQEMPANIKSSLQKLVGTWKMETVVDGKTTHSEVEVKWAPDESVIIFHWSGTDFDTGQQNSGSGMLGWDALRELVVEHEIDKDGATFDSTHHIEEGKWVSPTRGAIVVDGKGTYIEAHRVFTFKSEDEWKVVGRDRVIGGKPVPDAVSTFRRK